MPVGRQPLGEEDLQLGQDVGACPSEGDGERRWLSAARAAPRRRLSSVEVMPVRVSGGDHQARGATTLDARHHHALGDLAREEVRRTSRRAMASADWSAGSGSSRRASPRDPCRSTRRCGRRSSARAPRRAARRGRGTCRQLSTIVRAAVVAELGQLRRQGREDLGSVHADVERVLGPRAAPTDRVSWTETTPRSLPEQGRGRCAPRCSRVSDRRSSHVLSSAPVAARRSAGWEAGCCGGAASQ